MDKRLKKIAIKAALSSGALIRKSVGKVREISFKGRINIVTDVDKASERRILAIIHEAYPDHSILSEESAPKTTLSKYRWIIDPLDGTTNFAHAFPFFAVSIALEMSGEVILGVVYDPMRDELFLAEKGRGALLNSRPIHVAPTKRMRQAFLSTGFSYDVKKTKDNNVANFENFLVRAQAIRRPGAASLDIAYVACGRFDGFWERDLYPWDSAAAALIVKEAGGKVTRFDGSRASIDDREILVSNGLIHSSMIKILKIRL